MNDVEQQEVELQLQIIEKILSASDEEVSNFNWMLDCLQDYGIYPFEKNQNTFTHCKFSLNGLQQVPTEFAAFCNFLSQYHIDNALEIGVFRGRSSYIMCAILYRKNKNLKYYMLDIVDRLDYFDQFSSILPIYKTIPATSENYQGKEFDFVFIDADHSYDAVINDFINVGQYAKKLVCFHDIYAHEYDHLSGGTVRAWKEVSFYNHHLTCLTFSKFPNEWMGIGVGIRDKNNLKEQQNFQMVLSAAKENVVNFIECIKKYEHFIFYGAGYYAAKLYAYFSLLNKNIDMFIVSDGETKQNEYYGKPVWHFREFVLMQNKNTPIVLALPEKHQKAIGENLIGKGFENIIFVSDKLFSEIPVYIS